MTLFKIFVDERHIIISSAFISHSKFMELDGIGFVLDYNEEQEKAGEITPEFIRRHLSMLKGTYCYIEAESFEEAIEKCKEQLKEGLNMGEISKAQTINMDYYFEIPDCDQRNKNSRNEFICGKLTESDQGDLGMCFLEGYDGDPSCPIEFDLKTNKYYIREEEIKIS